MENNQNNYFKQLQEEDPLEIKKYLFIVLANWYWFAISLILSLSIAMMINRWTPPVYSVTSSLVISDGSRGRDLTGYENLIPGMEIFRTQKVVLNEIEVLKSYTLALRTLQNLNFGVSYVGVGRSGLKETNLYQLCPFVVIPDTSKTNIFNTPVNINIISKTQYEVIIDDQFKNKKIVKFGEKFESELFNFTILLEDPVNFNPQFKYNRYYFVLNNIYDLANYYRSSLSITTNDDRRGSVLFLSFSCDNQYQAAEYLNKLMEVYILKGLEEKNQTAINTVNFIDKQLEVIDTSLRKAEMDLQNFRLENTLFDISKEGTMIYTILEKNLEDKTLIELRKSYYNYLIDYTKEKSGLNEPVSPATLDIEDPLLTGLINQLNKLISEKKEILFTLKEGSPQLEVINAAIENTYNVLLSHCESMQKNNEIGLNEINRQLAEVNTNLLKLPVTERQLINIQRQYKVNDQIYTYLLQKRAESAVAKASNVADNKKLDMARFENAAIISPKTKMNYLIAFVIGILLPISLLVIIELINNKITNQDEIERQISVPIFGAIGHNIGKGDIPIFENPNSSLSESFRVLRTNLSYLLREKDQKVVTITSTISGEGKTFCSVNLAAVYAAAGKKTLLMSMDLRRPKIHKIFNLDNHVGISNCLIGQMKLENIIKSTVVENLFVAPSGQIPPNPAELIGSDAMQNIINEAKENYDIIILDTPPFGMVTDSHLLARLSDLSLFILRQNYSSKNILRLFEEVYSRHDIPQMGIILNDMKHKGYYGYGYRYYNYGSAYRYGYYYNYYDKESV